MSHKYKNIFSPLTVKNMTLNNRIESLILDLFNQLLNQYRGRQMLTFNFGIRREAF